MASLFQDLFHPRLTQLDSRVVVRALATEMMDQKPTATSLGASPEGHVKALVAGLRDRDRKIAGLDDSSKSPVRALVDEVMGREAPESYEERLIRQAIERDSTLMEPSRTIAAWLSKAVKVLPKPPGLSNESYYELLSRLSIVCKQKGRKGIGYRPSAIRDVLQPSSRTRDN
jgi:hypothetical protein